MPFVQLSATNDIPEGTAKVFNIQGQKIAVFNVRGKFYALADACSHADISLSQGEIDVEDLCVECPLHGSLFDLQTGYPRTLPAIKSVKTYSTKVEGALLFVDLQI